MVFPKLHAYVVAERLHCLLFELYDTDYLVVLIQGEQTNVQQEKGWAELSRRKYRWIMLLATLLPLFQQLSGINTCILYSSQARHPVKE